MNKTDLIRAYAKRFEMTIKDATERVEEEIEFIGDVLAEHGKISIVGFASLEVVDTPEREGRNPNTSETIIIPAGKRIKFKAGKGLKEKVAR